MPILKKKLYLVHRAVGRRASRADAGIAELHPEMDNHKKKS